MGAGRGSQPRAILVALAAFVAAALAAAGCGSSGETTATVSVTTTATGGETTTATTSTGSSGGGGGNPLSGISPPSGSKLLDSRSGNDVYYEHYSTSDSPKQVESTYNQELTSAGWSIESSGGSGGGWGPYGGSDYGLTAKREDDYFDVQAGGQSGHTAYFELCATSGGGSREDCNHLSNESNSHTSSGGSGGGSKHHKSNSGGS